MAAKTLESRINTESFSHASGSVPERGFDIIHPQAFFPRKWECSVASATFTHKKLLFPTQVGVFLVLPKDITTVFAFSHTCGSVPYTVEELKERYDLFPRKWECSYILASLEV